MAGGPSKWRSLQVAALQSGRESGVGHQHSSRHPAQETSGPISRRFPPPQAFLAACFVFHVPARSSVSSFPAANRNVELKPCAIGRITTDKTIASDE